jgi:glycerol kinase
MSYVLALDQGTTSTRALLFDADGTPKASAAEPLRQVYPADGWVEHDPEEIWQAARSVVASAMRQVGATAKDVAAIGITNQRETTVVWERDNGKAIANAIVWQDRRTADACATLRSRGAEETVRAKTGLLLDPYFSATKLGWLLDRAGARARAERGELLFGTIDSWLLWRLSGGRAHVTDATNASRTMLFDLTRQDWDDELLRLFRVPRVMLPRVLDCDADFASTGEFGGSIAIRGVAGDQQAAAIGQACVEPGMTKATFGTGCFVLTHVGDRVPVSRHRLLGTVAWRLRGRAAYALEGSVFNAGTVVQWLRDQLRAIPDAAASEAIAAALPSNGGVHLVPAFTGLGAPHWDPHARGAIVGLQRDSGLREIVRAGLESVAYQVHDLLEAMAGDGARPTELRVDGGMSANGWLMRFLAGICGVPVSRPVVTETTSLGAALLAGSAVGFYSPIAHASGIRRADRDFIPEMPADERERLLRGWREAIARVRTP